MTQLKFEDLRSGHTKGHGDNGGKGKAMRVGARQVLLTSIVLLVPFGLGTPPSGAVAPKPKARYKIVYLGSLPGCMITFPMDINNRGEIVGYAYDFPGHGASITGRAFLWREGKMVALRTLSGKYSHALNINDRGDIVGDANREERFGLDNLDVKHETLPVFWVSFGDFDLESRRDEIPLALSKAHGVAYRINNKRQVVGNDGRPFLWENSQRRDLNLPQQCRLVGINDTGEIVGYAYGGGSAPLDAERNERAFYWQDGKQTDLSGLGGKEAACAAINAQGVIAGWATNRQGQKRACLWNNQAPTELDTPKDLYSEASDINKQGVVVGEAWGKEGFFACIWQDGKMTDLNTLIPPSSGWILHMANSINDDGYIIGTGRKKKGGTTDAFVLIPLDRAGNKTKAKP
jgi:probable HAF family extracellular repeat protein